ncbi:tRNA-binding protein [Spiroplasma helicoides]|uniref:tRNA-binding protein n=1 Tax=Spiroplasma helicoides TaxID=216938 RepID=A0A1B3SLF2_9MOLU|nr:hypothetical protein [Spiroplasma helicoides]AOG60761.1 tRNA-binding protein [Spiroplasma helicoides]
MKIFANYNKQFDVLMVKFKDKEINSIKKDNNIVLLYNEDNLVGANIFSPVLNKNSDFKLEDEKLYDYVKATLKNHIEMDKMDSQFVISLVEDCKPIEGTHLSLCQVNDGSQVIQVVCGAKNVKKGLITCLATVGSFLPNGMQILKGSLKGYDSFGMLCSAKELGIIDEKYNNAGIIELTNDKSLIGKTIWSIL